VVVSARTRTSIIMVNLSQKKTTSKIAKPKNLGRPKKKTSSIYTFMKKRCRNWKTNENNQIRAKDKKQRKLMDWNNNRK